MPPKSEDSSLPIHVGSMILDATLELKHEVGTLGGKIDGLQSTVGDLHGRVAQCMTRDECAAVLHGRRHGPSPSAELRKRPDWWDSTQKKVGVIVGLLAIVGTLGGAFYWMSSAYNVIQRARVDIQATTERAAKKAEVAAKNATDIAASLAAKVADDAKKSVAQDQALRAQERRR